jgi:parallel beta-helix repeat protein
MGLKNDLNFSILEHEKEDFKYRTVLLFSYRGQEKMKQYISDRKCFTIWVILVLIGTSIIPSIHSERTYDKTIITVDDEPGDADFTSIKEAVNSSSPGDSIWVYSGTYREQGIHIINNNTMLLGIPHELGEGDDTGMPCIQGNGTAFVIHIEANHVLISNFTTENSYASNFTSHSCMMIGVETVPFYEEYKRDNITISDCVIRNTPRPGIWIGDVGENISIIHNEIHNCTFGVLSISVTHRFWTILNIFGNIITDCSRAGIYFDDTRQNISGNTIRRCGTGIVLYPAGTHNIIYGNDIDNCPVAVRSMYGTNTITKNNFKNYSLLGSWFELDIYLYLPGAGVLFYLTQKDTWVGNYWDSWKGIGSKNILGKLTIGRYIFYFPLVITIPWVEHDWHPATEPYDIPGIT